MFFICKVMFLTSMVLSYDEVTVLGYVIPVTVTQFIALMTYAAYQNEILTRDYLISKSKIRHCCRYPKKYHAFILI